MSATVGFMPHHLPEVFNHVITIGDNQRQVCFLSQGLHRFQAVLVLRIGVNIGIIPQGADFISLLSPVANRIGGTMSTTAVN